MSRKKYLLDGVSGFKVSAVLLLLDSRGRLLFTKRSRQVKTHKGQYSFPGGKREAGDQNLLDTALRETWEEIGVKPAWVNKIQALSPTYSPLGFIIHPYLGYLNDNVQFTLQKDEVCRIIRIPLVFFQKTRPLTKIFKRKGQSINVDFYRFGPHVIWGATARILSQLKIPFRKALTPVNHSVQASKAP